MISIKWWLENGALSKLIKKIPLNILSVIPVGLTEPIIGKYGEFGDSAIWSWNKNEHHFEIEYIAIGDDGYWESFYINSANGDTWNVSLGEKELEKVGEYLKLFSTSKSRD